MLGGIYTGLCLFWDAEPRTVATVAARTIDSVPSRVCKLLENSGKVLLLVVAFLAARLLPYPKVYSFQAITIPDVALEMLCYSRLQRGAHKCI